MSRIPRAVYTKELHDEAVNLTLTEDIGVSETSRNTPPFPWVEK